MKKNTDKQVPSSGSADGPTSDDIGPVYVFIRSWNRPLYLWACLDSLYRSTRYPCRFVLIDNHSSDPQVRQVVDGFQRRNFFEATHFMDQNHAANQTMVFFRYRAELGKYFILIDADITVEETEPCWLTRLIDTAERHADFSIIGSYIDKSDFIDPEKARQIAPDVSERQRRALIKADSPERGLPSKTGELFEGMNPPGRLLLLRTEEIDRIGLKIGNKRLCEAARAAGSRTAIAANVRHRHLSLLNFYDYPDYDFDQLNRYLQGS